METSWLNFYLSESRCATVPIYEVYHSSMYYFRLYKYIIFYLKEMANNCAFSIDTIKVFWPREKDKLAAPHPSILLLITYLIKEKRRISFIIRLLKFKSDHLVLSVKILIHKPFLPTHFCYTTRKKRCTSKVLFLKIFLV